MPNAGQIDVRSCLSRVVFEVSDPLTKISRFFPFRDKAWHGISSFIADIL
jgi:hypothetical protein